jgi:sigma-E factor negative regulatory protein RseB
MTGLRVALAYLLLLSPPAALANDGSEVLDWLVRMLEARRHVSYEGQFVYLRGGTLTAMRVIHTAGPDGVRERLFSLNGEPREVRREADRVTCNLPSNRSVVIARSRPERGWHAAGEGRLDGLDEFYTLRRLDPERVADRDTVPIEILPKDAYRYGHRLWVDREAGLLLKSELLDEGGKPLEQVMFTQVRVLGQEGPAARGGEAAGDSAPALSWSSLKGARRGAGAAPPVAWHADDLPRGFSLVEYDRHAMPGARDLVEHLVYADGLATVSVFVEHLVGEGHPAQASSLGSVNLFSRAADGYQLTAVGEVPGVTVRRIAESLARSDAGGER